MRSPAGRVTGARAAVLVGVLAAFVVAVEIASGIRPTLLVDPDPSWAIPRLLLGLFAIAAAAFAAGLCSGLFFLAERHWLSKAEPGALPFSRGALTLLSVAALAAGALLRFAALERLPPYVWVDDASLIAPTLALRGRPSDFADAIRSAPFGVPKPYGSVGVLYLEAFRGALHFFGTRLSGVRFLSAAGGLCSVATAGLLGRALLPRGGGTLAALTLAGLRWNLIDSRWGWVAIVLGPVIDLAAILLLRARRRGFLPLALLAGLAAGLAAHIYLAAWVAAAGLATLALWPGEAESPLRGRLSLLFIFVAGYGIAVAPLFLFREGRSGPYFSRVSSHNVLRETQRTQSAMPALRSVSRSLTAPWLGSDPAPLHDLPGRTILPWVMSLPVGVAFAWSFVRPRKEISGYLLGQGASALAASVIGGEAGLPNSYRFVYLASAATVAAACGMLLLLARAPAERRRTWATALIGVVLVSGALGAGDTLVRWAGARSTFDGFFGEDTLIARAAIRWERYGSLSIATGLGHSSLAVEATRRYRLDPDAPPAGPLPGHSARAFRVEPPSASARPDERVVERVRDAWGRDWAVVIGRRASNSGS